MDPVCKPVVPQNILNQNQIAWVKKNSVPRHIPKPPKIDRGPAWTDSGRLAQLAVPLPRWIYVPPKKDPTSWVYKLAHPVKDSAKNYNITGRVTELAEPHYGRQPKWQRQVRKYHRYKLIPLTERQEQLSQPKIPYQKYVEPPLVKPGAMTYTATERIGSLAEPTQRTVEQNEFAFTVNPIALKYFASQRTRAMAKPHQPMTEEQLAKLWAEHYKRKEAYDKKRAAKLAAEKKARLARHKENYKSLGL